MLYHGNIVQIAAIDLNSVLLEEGPSRLEADGDSREVEVIKTANPQWDGVLTAWLSQQFQTWAEIIHPLAQKHASFKWFLTVLSCSHLSWWVHFWGGDSWRSDNAWGHDCQTYCGFDFWLRSWLQSGWFPWWDEFIGLGRSSRCPACTRCALNLPKHCALFGGRFVWKSRQNYLFFSPFANL